MHRHTHTQHQHTRFQRQRDAYVWYITAGVIETTQSSEVVRFHLPGLHFIIVTSWWHDMAGSKFNSMKRWAGLSRVNVQTLDLSSQKHDSSFSLIILGWSSSTALTAGAAPDCSLSMRTSAPHWCLNEFLSPVAPFLWCRAKCCSSCKMNKLSYRLMDFTSLYLTDPLSQPHRPAPTWEENLAKMKLKTWHTRCRTSAKGPSSAHGKVKQVEKCEWDQVILCGIHKRTAGNEETCIDKKRGEV